MRIMWAITCSWWIRVGHFSMENMYKCFFLPIFFEKVFPMMNVWKRKNFFVKKQMSKEMPFSLSLSLLRKCYTNVLWCSISPRVQILPFSKSKSLLNDSNVSSGVCLNDQDCPRWVLPWTNHPTVDHKYIPLINSTIWLDWVQPMLSLDWTSGNPGSIWTATLTNTKTCHLNQYKNATHPGILPRVGAVGSQCVASL